MFVINNPHGRHWPTNMVSPITVADLMVREGRA